MQGFVCPTHLFTLKFKPVFFVSITTRVSVAALGRNLISGAGPMLGGFRDKKRGWTALSFHRIVGLFLRIRLISFTSFCL